MAETEITAQERIWTGAPLAPGTFVGEYQVTHKLGEGGMGVVYAGVHPEIGKRVAIKVLAPHSASHPDVIRRFKEEARAVNRIRHPNIIDIFAFNQLADGRHYFVMEYLEGESLATRLSRAPMALGEARRLLAQICDGLEAAHRAGVIHRDLKPDNIWVALEGTAESRIKLLDFGIAKLSDLAAGRVTQAGTQLGTPHYMPPEQGLGREVDARADVYALGVVLYEMFAGVLPFDGLTSHEIVLKHVTEPPEPPSRHRAIEPPEIEAIILACLEKVPDRRPASIKEVGARIDAAFSGASASAAAAISPRATPRRPTSQAATAVMPQTGPIAPAAPGQTAPLPPPPVTTLQESAGQIGTQATAGGPALPARSRGGRVWIGAVAAAVLAGAAYAALGHRASPLPPVAVAPVATPSPIAIAPPPPAGGEAAPAARIEPPPANVTIKNVTIKIDSVPSGARVIDASDGSVVGTTPLSISRTRADAALAWRLELDGFKPRGISVPLRGDFAQAFELDARPAPKARPRRVTPAAPAPRAPAPAATAPAHQTPKKAAEIEWE